MNVLRRRSVRVGLLFAVLLFVGLHLRNQLAASPPAQAQQTRPIPLEGLVAEIDTGGKVPGNPNNAVSDLQQFYKLIEVYRGRKGQFPENTHLLWRDIGKEPQAYGFSTLQQARPIFMNPDSRYSDDSLTRKSPNLVAPYFIGARPDGTPVGGPKLANQRDVLVCTNLYTHRNIRHLPNAHTEENPVGYFVVLWDDGKIEQVPYDQQLYAPDPANKGRFKLAFPGQAGVPSNALTYDEFYRLVGWKKGPRGSVGGEGQSYRDKPRP